MKRVSRALSVPVSLAIMLLSGCSHRLEIKNISDFQSDSINPLSKPLSIGIIFDGSDSSTKRIVKGVANSLQMYSTRTYYPFSPNGIQKADIIVKMDIPTEYEGSPANFFINWPGFLIWTPAWNGYVYKVNYPVKVQLINGSDNKTFGEFDLPINLDIRHASIGRSWSAGCGWFFWTVSAFVGGFVVTNYDTIITPLVVDQAHDTLGKYIADEIISRINASGKFSRLQILEDFVKA